MIPSSSDRFENPRTRSQRVARIALLTAVAVAGGYLLIAIPNVELLSVTIAFAGLLLGGTSGAVVGLASGGIFGVLNVIGLPYPPVWIAQLIGYALTGYFFGTLRKPLLTGLVAAKLGLLGFSTTLIYDILTNLAFPLATGVAPAQWWAYIIAGIPFALTHLIANTLIFALLLPVAYRRLGNRFSM